LPLHIGVNYYIGATVPNGCCQSTPQATRVNPPSTVSVNRLLLSLHMREKSDKSRGAFTKTLFALFSAIHEDRGCVHIWSYSAQYPVAAMLYWLLD